MHRLSKLGSQNESSHFLASCCPSCPKIATVPGKTVILLFQQKWTGMAPGADSASNQRQPSEASCIF